MLIRHYIFVIAAVSMLVGVGIGIQFNREAYRNAFQTVLKHHKAQCTKVVNTIAVMAYLKGKEDGCITH